MGQHHYWRSLFAQLYIGFGIFAWFFPTHEPSEIVARGIFIAFGVIFLFTFHNNKTWAVWVLRVSIGLIVLWIGIGVGMILRSYDNPEYRIHLGYMPFWYLLIRLHYKAIRELEVSRELNGD